MNVKWNSTYRLDRDIHLQNYVINRKTAVPILLLSGTFIYNKASICLNFL